MKRDIERVLHGEKVTEGAGVRLRRIFGFGDTTLFDPFLLLDDFRSDSREDFIRGFPWHPHRGIETITYVLQGDVEHKDSLGNSGVISSGDVQWMTAGSGIIHQEMPKGDSGGKMDGFQLWANLPAKDKMMKPQYREIAAAEIPQVQLDNGVMVKIIAGTVAGISGPVDKGMIDPEYLDCLVPANADFVYPTTKGYKVFIYVIEGKGRVGDTEVGNGDLVLFGDGDEIGVKADDYPVRFLFLSGKPLREPVAWRGPIVMNTEEELTLAFKELQEDTFLQHS